MVRRSLAGRLSLVLCYAFQRCAVFPRSQLRYHNLILDSILYLSTPHSVLVGQNEITLLFS